MKPMFVFFVVFSLSVLILNCVWEPVNWSKATKGGDGEVSQVEYKEVNQLLLDATKENNQELIKVIDDSLKDNKISNDEMQQIRLISK